MAVQRPPRPYKPQYFSKSINKYPPEISLSFRDSFFLGLRRPEQDLQELQEWARVELMEINCSLWNGHPET